MNGTGIANYDSEMNVHVCDTNLYQHNAWAIALDMSARKKNRQMKTVLTGGSATAKRIPTDDARSGETLKCET